MTRRVLITLIVLIVIVTGAAGGYLALKQRQEAARRRAERVAAESFVQAWKAGTLANLEFAGSPGADVAADVASITSGMSTATKDLPADVVVTSITAVGSDRATAGLQVSWALPGTGSWAYPSSLALLHRGGRWLPQYAPSVIHPKLTTGAKLRVRTAPASRGRILGAGGAVLVKERPVVVVGVQRSRTQDVQGTSRQLAALTGISAADLATRVQAAGADAFVPAITLRDADYQALRDRLQPIPGAVFQAGRLPLAPSAGFARALLGTVGEATAEIVQKSGGRVLTGDTTGLSGLQASYDEQLSGSRGITVQLVPAPATGTDPLTLFSSSTVAGKDLQTTLDQTIQAAADAALEQATKPAALIAIRPETGAVLAVANGGPNATGYDRALLGRYPPGSTFKIASTLALLGAGLTPQTTLDCPASVTIGGKAFKNAEAERFGPVPFHRDFANSCNTAFVASSTKVSATELATAARSLGYGQPSQLGVTAFTGSVPTSGDAVSHAAAMIGQDKVLASPLIVAGTAAAVAAGRWMPPRLVLPDGEKLTGAASDGLALPEGTEAELKSLMREVVTSGTGAALSTVAGGEVYGKTGTAEFGQQNPPQTHAWFTGFQGDVAFAVVVEDGGFGAKTAVPLVKDFLTRLAN